MGAETVIAGVGGALLGGFGGAWLSHALARPLPKLNIVNIEVAALQSPEEAAISEEILSKKAKEYLLTPQNMVDLFKEHKYLSGPSNYYQHPQLYTWFLYQASRDNERVRLEHRVMPSIVKAMQNNFHVGLYNELFQLFVEHISIIWSHVAGEFKRGKFDVDETAILDDAPNPKHPLSIDEDGDYFVNYGKFNIPFIWSNEKVHRDKLKIFSEKVAKAFQYENELVIGAILDFLENVVWDDPILSRADDLIEKELLRYSRVVVRGTFSNAGRAPCSISGNGKILILSKGYIIGNGANAKIVDNDTELPLKIVDQTFLRQNHSLQAEAGSTTSFIAVSEKYIHEMDNGDDVCSIFGTERECQISFPQVGTKDSVKSKSVKFKSE